MLNNLVLNNFQSGWDTSLLECDGNFIMKTCQRTLVLSFGQNPCKDEENTERLHLSGEDAYSYLLEVICGLKSQLVGENEIVGQFKTAYKAYTAQEDINTNLLLIIEKLFRDAKTIRSKYLLGLSQKTYASIARKQIVRHRNAEEVLILGSGQLAEDLINQFKKKAKVFVCARNKERVQELVKEHNIESIDWVDLEEVSNFAFIVNSIGFDGTLFDNDFFEAWTEKFDNKLFIDLGSPSILETEFGMEEGVMHLQDIFKEGAIHESRKKQQIKKARVAMEGIAARRHKLLETKLQSKILNTPANKTKIAYV
ncbi:MAG: hypothetical protein CME64_00505 [Halobacteriovoraceae bacterium]|nr:hypothetical protein [Halobacteriovoraceae bacterium]